MLAPPLVWTHAGRTAQCSLSPSRLVRRVVDGCSTFDGTFCAKGSRIFFLELDERGEIRLAGTHDSELSQINSLPCSRVPGRACTIPRQHPALQPHAARAVYPHQAHFCAPLTECSVRRQDSQLQPGTGRAVRGAGTSSRRLSLSIHRGGSSAPHMSRV